MSTSKRRGRPAKVSPEERARLERLSGKLQMAEATAKRTKSRLMRAFGAWQRAEVKLARIIKAIERPPTTEEPAEPLPFNDSLDHL